MAEPIEKKNDVPFAFSMLNFTLLVTVVFFFAYSFLFGSTGSFLLCTRFLKLLRAGDTLQLPYPGFSLWRLLLLGSIGFRVFGLSSCSWWVQ